MPTQQESNSSILAELYNYNPSALVELFELDLSPIEPYYKSKGITISPLKYYFHNGYNQKHGTVDADVKWGNPENTYIAKSIQIDGVQASSSGEIAKPTLTISTLDQSLLFIQLCKAYANLVGAKITRIRTLVKFLNSSNFPTTNLLLNSQAFDTWTQDVDANTTVTANAAIAPNGTWTADKLFEATTTSSAHGVTKDFAVAASNVNVCCSVHLKASERTNATLRFRNKSNVTSAVTFNLSTGVASSGTGTSFLRSGIQPMGNGWYRCWIVCLSGTSTTTPQMQLYIDNNSDPSGFSYAGTLNSGIFVWGAQAEVITNTTLTPTLYQVVGPAPGNPTADPNAKFPDDVYFIDRMAEETSGQITFELAPAWDVEGIQLPRRQIIANICPWTYKEDPCNWSVTGSSTVNNFTGTSGGSATIAATITGTILNVTSVTGTIIPGMLLTGGTVYLRTRIEKQLTGTTGGIGTYLVNISQNSTGITSATVVGVHYGRSTTTSGSGKGAKLQVTIASTSSSYSSATISVVNPGTGYNVGDTLTVSGEDLGGVSPTNNLTVTINSITSGPYYNSEDQLVTLASDDVCGKRLTSCKVRFGTRVLPFGGFPSAGIYGKPI